MVATAVRAHVVRWLEEGTLIDPCSRAVAMAHGALAARRIARRLHVPGDMPTVAVGGATLGGSGKTRVALASARFLGALGAHVVLVGHAYRARPSRARTVSVGDTVDDVGDEALACARAVALHGGHAADRASGRGSIRVVVGPSRQAAVDLASSLVPRVDVLVLDGPLQLAPCRASLALLALDAFGPWGAGRPPPAGDLRAPQAALLAHADHVVMVDSTPSVVRFEERTVPIASLLRADPATGLFTALARPARLDEALLALGHAPGIRVRAPDHGPLTSALARMLASATPDLWLATEKCATHLERLALRAPVGVLDGSCTLPIAVEEALGRVLSHPRTLTPCEHRP